MALSLSRAFLPSLPIITVPYWLSTVLRRLPDLSMATAYCILLAAATFFASVTSWSQVHFVGTATPAFLKASTLIIGPLMVRSLGTAYMWPSASWAVPAAPAENSFG